MDCKATWTALHCKLLSEHGKGNNSVITNKILWNWLLHQITGPLYAEKIKGLTWCFPKFWNTPLYRFEIPIVKIKYNVWYYRPISRRESMLEIEELYTSRKYSFQVLLYWYLNWIFWITVFFFPKRISLYLVYRVILTDMKGFPLQIFSFGLLMLSAI